MSSECSNDSCCTTTESSNCGTDQECCDMPEKLIAIADEAWYEVVKDKIKKEIEATCGEKLDKLAQIVASANNQRWTHQIQGKVLCEEYKNNIKELFGSCAKEKE